MSRLSAALLAHHAANVNRATPWPAGHGANTTKGATMPDPDPIETIAEVIWGTDYDYEQRYRAKCVVSAIRTKPELRRSLWLALTADNPLNRVSKAPSSPVGATDASARPPAPDAPNGLSSGPDPLGDVLAQMPGTRLLIDAEVAAKDAEIEASNEDLRASFVRLTKDHDDVCRMVTAKDATIADRDTRIAAVRAVAAHWATKRDQPHRPMPWRSVYAQFVDGINDALDAP